ncbi:hypothetical protein BDN70DRAFT_934551 [Pholiota conissans]|uniref:Uncharacterized protein n=1 Tax=Pholiota conissans TaxID=109636 RepID=A0A9P6CYV8_9AGAR|nr:hypothetical protein BDN70DRAFT_934551 [Pholiota conissans]
MPKAGVIATANRLETFPTVQNALKNVGNRQELAFLKTSAATSIEILRTIQNMEDNVDDNLANFALDACGLVYLIIHQCSQHVDRAEAIARNQQDAVELERTLNDAYSFAQKKAGRKLRQRFNPIKMHDDKQKTVTYRASFRQWMLKFGSGAQGTIHDTLQVVIDSKISDAEQRELAARQATLHASTLESIDRITSDMGNIHLTNDDRSHNTMTMPDPIPNPSPPMITISDAPSPSRASNSSPPVSMPEAGPGWKTERHPEQSQWRKSLEDFKNLPPASPDDELPRSHSPLSHQYPTPANQQRNTLPSPSFQRYTDADLLEGLRQRYPHYTDDQLHDLLIAGKEQLQEEAEEKKRRSSPQPRRNGDNNRTPSRPSSSQNESSFRRPPLHPHGTPDSTPSPSFSYGSASPSTTPPTTPPMYPNGIGFHNIAYSGISLGGGPVHVRNENVGNTTTTYNINSGNNNSKVYYAK